MGTHKWAVVKKDEVPLSPVTDPLTSGLSVAELCGRAQGAVHLDVSLGELAPGGYVEGHLHPHEESFYILSGTVLFQVADQSYELTKDGFGFAPIGTSHAWRNISDEPVRWLRTKSPQTRLLGEADGVHPTNTSAPTEGKPADVPDNARLRVGQFEEGHMPVPGHLAMKGLRTYGPGNVAVWMLVDEQIGAQHHTKFSVRFDPTGPGMTLGGQHYHPFEETYYITHGTAIAHLEDQSIPVGPGDLVFAGVNSLHGFTNEGTEPVRWIEMQAPNPPISDAFFFAGKWENR